jgi:hypothetical protein
MHLAQCGTGRATQAAGLLSCRCLNYLQLWSASSVCPEHHDRTANAAVSEQAFPYELKFQKLVVQQ